MTERSLGLFSTIFPDFENAAWHTFEKTRGILFLLFRVLCG